ncbi:ADP-ribose pyrophosphatase [Photobacterium aquae]|uniref:GDP-mannose pyrophosphatase n=1 Tax=Photobacterium aquae TaxID=1195763 RepID=A0A0J1H0Q8_9GAMM|nr:NUDIX hydrolase [Photobacterium aquae]KLV05413.1 ADP-ribose pyrophosphatase [Photobacterium aquae]
MTQRTLCQWKCFSVEQSEHQLPDGRHIEFTTVKHPGAVIVLPITNQGDLVMVKQYRPAIGKWILEFPAGTLEPNEDILTCAQRELAEEAQLQARDWQAMGDLFPVPGFCDEVQHVYLARGLSPANGELDEDEIIEVVTLTPQAFISNVADGKINDAKTLATFLKAQASGYL